MSSQVLWLTFWLLDCFLGCMSNADRRSRHQATLCQEDPNSSLSWVGSLLAVLIAR